MKRENRQNKLGENRDKTGKNKFPNIVYCYPERYKNMHHLYETKMVKRMFRKQKDPLKIKTMIVKIKISI